MTFGRLRAVPFRPVIFNPALADLSQLIAPPYDIIDEATCEVLLARHPYNIVRLILPPSLYGRQTTRYDDAALIWQQWRKDGILLEIDEPSLFVSVQRFPWRGGSREHWVLLATIPLMGYSTGFIRPHEQTMPQPKSDRLTLLRAMGAELSQVHGLLSDETGEWTRLLQTATQGDAWLKATLDGVEHLVWRVTDSTFAEAVNSFLSSQWLVIADGHHRYETALTFRAELPEAQADPNHPANFVSIVLADCQRNATVLPTHRLLRFQDQESVERVLREWMRRFRTITVNWDGSDEMAEQLLTNSDSLFATASRRPIAPSSHRPIVTFLLVAQERVKQAFVYGFESDVAHALEQLPPPLRGVDTAILHHGVLPVIMAGAGVVPEQVAIDYTHSAATANTFAQQDNCLAILLRPIPPQTVRDIAQHGLRLPPKTTYFFPKAPSGLIMRQIR